MTAEHTGTAPIRGGGPVKRPRVVIAEDHVLIQELIREVVERECDVVAAVEDGRAAMEAVGRLQPDVLLVDAALPLTNGFAVAEKLRATHPQVKVLFVTAHAEPAYVKRAFRIGAKGYLMKGSIRVELLKAIREVLAGGQYTSPMLQEKAETA